MLFKMYWPNQEANLCYRDRLWFSKIDPHVIVVVFAVAVREVGIKEGGGIDVFDFSSVAERGKENWGRRRDGDWKREI